MTSAPTNVLVVEDEMVLRMRAVDIVEDAGFTAVEAVNADEALAILESRSDIALLFSDIQMPGTMDGLKLAHAVHERWPAIKIILVSGQVKVTDADKPADSVFIGKPLDVKQMVVELQAMVGKGALKIVPDAVLPLAVRARVAIRTRGTSRKPARLPRMTASGCYLSRPASTPRRCSRRPASTPRSGKPQTNCRSSSSKNCITASRTRSPR